MPSAKSLTLPALLALWTACSRTPSPVVPGPCPPTNPPAVTVQPDPTPCKLPALPQPLQLHTRTQGNDVLLTWSESVLLAAYVAEAQTWMTAASVCMGAK